MQGVNKVILLGHLGADPEERFLPNGERVVTISVATSEKWKDSQTGQDKEVTDWHRVVLFNRLAEIAAQYLKKGAGVYIEGKNKTRSWEGPDGAKKYAFQVAATKLEILPGKSERLNTIHDDELTAEIMVVLKEEGLPGNPDQRATVSKDVIERIKRYISN